MSINVAQLQQYEENIQRDIAILKTRACEKSLSEFTRNAWDIIEPGTPLIWNWHLDVICAYLEATTRKKYAFINRLIINVPPGSMKPVSINEPIMTDRGFKQLKDITAGDNVLTHKGRFKRVKAVHEQGMQDSLQIITNSGRIVKTALDHPFLTPRGWIEAQYLTKEDYLAVPKVVVDFGDNSVSNKEARLIGYLVGNGCISTRNSTFTNQDKDVLQDFIVCAKAVGFYAKARKHNNSKRKAVLVGLKAVEGRFTGKVNPLHQWLQSLQLFKVSNYAKRIPKQIFKSGPEAIRNFLGAYWSCDGMISVDRKAQRTTSLALVITVSNTLAHDLLRALSLVNINCCLRTKVIKRNSKKQPGGLYTSFDVVSAQRNEVAKIVKLPGLCKRKRLIGKEAFFESFDPMIFADRVIDIKAIQPEQCRCLTVEGDASFTVNMLAVHNSILVSVMFPAWMWIQNPGKKVLGIANVQDLAIRDSRRTKQIIQNEWYQDQWPLAFKSDQSAKTNYENEAGGFRQSIGITANSTGKRGNYLLLDDLHDARDVQSDVQRQSVLDIYDEKISTRLNKQNSDVIILIMQRLHHMDITGHLLAKKKTRWTHVVIPMHYDSAFTYDPVKDLNRPDLIDPRTKEGELLFPKMFPQNVVEGLEEDMGSHVSQGQLEQRPSVKGGGIIKQSWFRVFNKEDPLPVCDHIFISCDTAYSERDLINNSYSAFTTWGVFWNAAQERDCILLLDVWYDRVDYPDLRRKAKEVDDDVKPDIWLIEKKASGISLVQDLRRTGIHVRTYQPDRDKVTRAYSVQAMLESGQVWIPDRKWAHKFTHLLSTFPTGVIESNDLTDTFTQALIYIRNGWYVTHPDDEEHDVPKVRRISAYGGHLADIEEEKFSSIDGIDPRELIQ